MRVILFGTGSAAKDVLSMLPADVDVLALTDNDAAKHGTVVEGRRVISPTSLLGMDVDLVVIAARAVDSIRAGLVAIGFPAEKIAAYYPSYSDELNAAANRDIEVLNRALGLGLAPLGLATMYLDKVSDTELTGTGPADFVRDKAFQLAARQINDRKVPGAVAELGVYRGDQARLINRLFPSRPIYLFDTFSGFSARDLGAECADGLSSAAVGDFVDTSVELVKSKLEHPHQARIFPGFFPDSAQGVDDIFAFVSLDVDLYEPTRAGLEWFYPRLQRGGFIFVHDYNNRRYLGVRKAVDEFVAASEASFVPLPDFAGSAVISR